MKKYLKIISIICLAVFLGFGFFAHSAFASVGKCATSSAEAESLMGGSNLYICAPATGISENFCDPGEIPYACIETIPTPTPPPTTPTTPAPTTFGGGECVGECVDERGLVPCGPGSLGFRYECDVCGMMKLVDNIIDFMIKVITPALATIMIVIGAIFLMTTGGSATQLSKGKNYIKMALLGTTIVLTSWIIIDTIMKSFYDENKFGTWNEFYCPQTEN